ncbi:MAG: hypothetical protein QNK17_03025, partial [Hyphomicrobiaceae bacterium]|nr:hypothetical protein [Hyphomicrobiaceae bacterium]MDX2449390.1 hypothetical protein [Hyphomicrobiaceae bacterium]
QELVERRALNFQLVRDGGGRLAGALHSPSFAAGEESYLKRLTLVAADARIEKVFCPVSDAAAHAGEVLAYLTNYYSPSASPSASSTE